MNAIKAGKLVTGSIARVADCCPQPNDPFQCITKLGGLCSEAEYPTPTGKCIPNQCEPVLKVKRFLWDIRILKIFLVILV